MFILILFHTYHPDIFFYLAFLNLMETKNPQLSGFFVLFWTGRTMKVVVKEGLEPSTPGL